MPLPGGDRGEQRVERGERVRGRVVAELVGGVHDVLEHVLDDLAADSPFSAHTRYSPGNGPGIDSTSWSRSVPYLSVVSSITDVVPIIRPMRDVGPGAGGDRAGVAVVDRARARRRPAGRPELRRDLGAQGADRIVERA